MKEMVRDFFQVFEWLPSNHGVESYHSPSMFFCFEELVLKAAALFWIMPIGLFFLFSALIISVLFGFEPKGDMPLSVGFYFALGSSIFPVLLQQTAKLLFLRKVNDEQFSAMEKWHEKLSDLPKPHSDMTKRNLAIFVDKAYKQESETRKKNSIMDV